MKITGAAVAVFLLAAAVVLVRPGVLLSQAAAPAAPPPAAPPPAAPPPAAPPPAAAAALTADDDAAIRKTIKGIEEAWNAHDMDAYGRLLRADVEWVNVVGMHWRGRDAVMAAHIAFHKTTFKNHHIKTDDIHLRPLCPGFAIAVVTTTNDAFTAPDGRVIDKRQDRQTYVLGKEADGWKIVHCQNVWVDPEAAKHDPTKPPGQ